MKWEVAHRRIACKAAIHAACEAPLLSDTGGRRRGDAEGRRVREVAAHRATSPEVMGWVVMVM